MKRYLVRTGRLVESSTEEGYHNPRVIGVHKIIQTTARLGASLRPSPKIPGTALARNNDAYMSFWKDFEDFPSVEGILSRCVIPMTNDPQPQDRDPPLFEYRIVIGCFSSLYHNDADAEYVEEIVSL